MCGFLNMDSKLQIFFPWVLWGIYCLTWNMKMLKLRKHQTAYHNLQTSSYSVCFKEKKKYMQHFIVFVPCTSAHKWSTLIIESSDWRRSLRISRAFLTKHLYSTVKFDCKLSLTVSNISREGYMGNPAVSANSEVFSLSDSLLSGDLGLAQIASKVDCWALTKYC